MARRSRTASRAKSCMTGRDGGRNRGWGLIRGGKLKGKRGAGRAGGAWYAGGAGGAGGAGDAGRGAGTTGQAEEGHMEEQQSHTLLGGWAG